MIPRTLATGARWCPASHQPLSSLYNHSTMPRTTPDTAPRITAPVMCRRADEAGPGLGNARSPRQSQPAEHGILVSGRWASVMSTSPSSPARTADVVGPVSGGAGCPSGFPDGLSVPQACYQQQLTCKVRMYTLNKTDVAQMGSGWRGQTTT